MYEQNQNYPIPDQITNCTGADNEKILQDLNDLEKLPRLIYSYEINSILEQAGMISKPKTMTEALKLIPETHRNQIIKDIETKVENIFHYAFELNFKSAEANYWRVRYILSQASTNAAPVYEAFVKRTLAQAQDAKIEQFFFEQIIANNRKFDKETCASINMNLTLFQKGEKTGHRPMLKKLSDTACAHE